jgi:hypothetical protein
VPRRSGWVVALPADARTQEQLEWLAEEIAEANGTSTLWRAELTSASQERDLIRERAVPATRRPSLAEATGRRLGAV